MKEVDEHDGILFVKNAEKGMKVLNIIKEANKVETIYVIGSTRTSTIPGISVAGATPEATLFTPALDVEYLIYGRTVSMREIPVTPEGIPTPAVLTRAVLNLSKLPFFVVDSGSYLDPKIPKIILPSRSVGGRIDVENAFEEGVAERLYKEGEVLARTMLRDHDVVAVGESIPGGTTTALSIMVSLGYNAWGLVSSAGPENPIDLKRRVVSRALERCKASINKDPFAALDCMGDPVHVAMAGIASACIEDGITVVLSGGTQMGAVLAIMKNLGAELKERVVVGTTRWIIEDRSSDIIKIVDIIDERVPILAFNYDFSNAPFEGLKYYERGFVKEGVGAGGTAILASAVRGLKRDDIVKAVYEEYRRLVESE